jgi:glycosyltransferase involved in cell wall biosynthesis
MATQWTYRRIWLRGQDACAKAVFASVAGAASRSGYGADDLQGSPPRVSIVIASYQYGRFISDAIESALGQTVPCEVIVVDDGSTDDSVEIARRYPVQVAALEHQGVCEARNHGAKMARGDYLLFLDADDVLVAEHVEKCLYALMLASPRIAYAYTPMDLFGSETGRFASRPFSARSLTHSNFVNVSSLIRREAFERVGGFDPEMRVGLEDYELWLRMLDHGYEGIFVDEVALRYRRHGKSRNHFGESEKKKILERFREKFSRLYDEYNWYLFKGDGIIRRHRVSGRL